MTVTINKKVSVQDRYKTFLNLAAAFFNIKLSKREIDILNEFYWKNNGTINTESRKEVAKTLDMSEHNLNNYLSALRGKKIITDESISEQLILHMAPTERNFGIMFLLES